MNINNNIFYVKILPIYIIIIIIIISWMERDGNGSCTSSLNDLLCCRMTIWHSYAIFNPHTGTSNTHSYSYLHNAEFPLSQELVRFIDLWFNNSFRTTWIRQTLPGTQSVYGQHFAAAAQCTGTLMAAIQSNFW